MQTSKDSRQRAAHAPVAEIGHLLLDHLRDHRFAEAAEQGRHDVVAECEDEHERATGEHARQVSGK